MNIYLFMQSYLDTMEDTEKYEKQFPSEKSLEFKRFDKEIDEKLVNSSYLSIMNNEHGYGD